MLLMSMKSRRGLQGSTKSKVPNRHIYFLLKPIKSNPEQCADLPVSSVSNTKTTPIF